MLAAAERAALCAATTSAAHLAVATWWFSGSVP